MMKYALSERQKRYKSTRWSLYISKHCKTCSR